MKNASLAVAVGLCMLGAFYMGMNGESSSDVEIREDAANDFDFKPTDLRGGPRRAPAMPMPEMPMRDAVASSRPTFATAAPAPAAAAPVAAKSAEKLPEKPAPSAAAKAGFASLLSSPARYLVSKTMLGKPGELARKLERKEFGKSYVQTPIVRSVLESPSAVSAILGNAALRRAFLDSPAMRDPRVVDKLGESALLQYVLTSDGVQKALGKPGVLQSVLMAPDTLAWMQRSPENRALMTRLTASMSRRG